MYLYVNRTFLQRYFVDIYMDCLYCRLPAVRPDVQAIYVDHVSKRLKFYGTNIDSKLTVKRLAIMQAQTCM